QLAVRLSREQRQGHRPKNHILLDRESDRSARIRLGYSCGRNLPCLKLARTADQKLSRVSQRGYHGVIAALLFLQELSPFDVPEAEPTIHPGEGHLHLLESLPGTLHGQSRARLGKWQI